MTLNRRVAHAVLVAAAACLLLSGCAASPAASSTTPSSASATPTATRAPSATPSATPTPTPEPKPPLAFVDCYDMITPDYLAEVERLGWVGWNMVGEAIGHSPFDEFPSGAPDGQLSCRWGEGPEIATDNVLDLAWAPIDAETAAGVQAHLADQGFEMIEAPEGTYYAVRSDATGWSDSEGFGQSYLFTGTDVRWAQVKEDLSLIRTA